MSKETKNIKIRQILPQEKEVPLKGLYLKHNLRKIAEKLGRAIIFANYVSDKNDVIAQKHEKGNWQVAKEVKNSYDWRLFQELMAQADIIISGTDYFKRFKVKGKKAQDILTQFDKGNEFEKLGDWRLDAGYEKRSPDIAVSSRSLDFTIPDRVAQTGRRILVFTTYGQTASDGAKRLKEQGAEVIGAGKEGVQGKILYDALNKKGYKVIEMATGPRVLKILLDANVLDRIYITQVQIEIPYKDPSDIQKILVDGGKVEDLTGFKITEKYIQEHVSTEKLEDVTQEFLVYDNTKFANDLEV